MTYQECLYYSHGICGVTNRGCPYHGDEKSCDHDGYLSEDPDYEEF